ncbi:MAG: hypothetical protein IBJ03_08505 [Gemmatimonadaceae bacterium]|nr:hypothetical protein [Gemmatimonadaceae bacterium]
MRSLFRLIVLLATPTLVEAQSTGASTFDIARLKWLAGCWEQRTPTRTVQEQWMAPEGGTMHGASRTVTGPSTRAWEWLRIAPVNGRLSYIAIPSGQTETAFAATTVQDTLAVFENPAHDFPQVIAYRRVSKDSIVARISAVTNGRTRDMDIPMRRKVCDQ